MNKLIKQCLKIQPFILNILCRNYNDYGHITDHLIYKIHLIHTSAIPGQTFTKEEKYYSEKVIIG